MSEEEVNKDEKQDATPQAAAKKGGPMKLIIIGVVVFVVGIAGFSMMMGVFSGGPSVKAPSEHTEEVAESEDHHNQPTEELSDLEEIKRLEEELMKIDNIDEAEDLDDVMALAEESGHSSETDSLAAVNWLEAEKAKLAKERKDMKSERAKLDKLKKELDTREYHLQQQLAKIGQVESARTGALAKLYDGMKPEQVAPLITKLTEEQAVQVLLKMKPGNAAKILAVLKADQAARISSRMITLSEE